MARGAHGERAPGGHARAGVHGEGHDHLLERVGVDPGRREPLRDARPDAEARERGVPLEQAQGEGDGRLEVRPVAGRRARGVEQEAHDPLAARDLRPDEVAELARLPRGAALALRRERGERLGAAGDAGEGVRDLVGHAGDELAEEGEAVGGDEAHLHLAPRGDVLEPGDDVGDLAAAAHGQAPHVEEAALRLHDLLVRPARAEHLAQHGLGGAEAGGAQHRPQGPADGAAARAADRPLLAPPVPGRRRGRGPRRRARSAGRRGRARGRRAGACSRGWPARGEYSRAQSRPMSSSVRSIRSIDRARPVCSSTSTTAAAKRGSPLAVSKRLGMPVRKRWITASFSTPMIES